MTKILRRASYLSGFFFIAVAGFLVWAVGTNLPEHSLLPINTVEGATPKAVSSEITVLTYNIAHGQGIKVDATDWRESELTIKKTNEVADIIKKIDADIVMLQEVDLASNRTHYVNELDVIQRTGNYAYSACATVWEKNYVPFPYWPPTHHIGRIKSANCILSRYPLKDHERIVYPKPKSNYFWYNWGYMDRVIQKATVQIGANDIAVINMHLEAWDIKTREEQAGKLVTWLQKIESPAIIGGDFNSLPPEATVKADFIDEPGSNFTKEQTIAIIRQGLGKDMHEAIDATRRSEDEHQTFTYPADHPSRQLDHIFTRGLTFAGARVLLEAGDASDHLPIWGRVKLPG